MNATCSNCQATLAGEYCSSCGQKANANDRSLGALLHGLLDGLISYDNKVWKTLVPLLTRPGKLTLDFVEGRRQRHFDPVRMFLLVSVLIFFAPDTLGMATYELPEKWAAPAATEASFLDRAKVGAERLKNFAKEEEVTRDRFSVTVAKRYLTFYMVAGVLGLALFLKLVHRKRYFADHLVFALHIAIFMYLWNWMVRFLAMPEFPTAILTGIGQVGYLMIAYWRIYGWPGWKGRSASIVGGLCANAAFAFPYGIAAQISAIYMLMPQAA